MDTVLILGTEQGVITALKRGRTWVEASHNLNNQRVTSITKSSGRILAGTTQGLYRAPVDLTSDSDTEDMLSKLEFEPLRIGIGSTLIRYLSAHPTMDKRVLAGTEPAEIFVSQDGGDTWRNCPEVVSLRERHGWYLPYSPEAGCVRGFAFHGRRAYAAVEVGGVLISDDLGETWHLAEGSSGDPDQAPSKNFIHPDVHSIEVHPSSENLVIAPTGGSLFRSEDGGTTWSNLYRCYTRAAWLDSEDAKHIIFGPADSVDQGGRIEMTRDGGQNWMRADKGLDAPWREYMAERFVRIGDDLLAVLSNGRLALASLKTMEWEFILPQIPFVLSAAGVVVGE